MRSNPLLRFQSLGALLALTAVVILLGVAGHGHDDPCQHDECWVCHSSLGHIGLPAASFLVLVVWVYRSRALYALREPQDIDSSLHTAPRAPPC